ncbi:DUF4279 domain-containing protein [Aerosakkonema funiforme]
MVQYNSQEYLPTAEELLESDEKAVDDELQNLITNLLLSILATIWSNRQDWFFGVLEQLQVGWLPLVEVCSQYYAEIACVIYYRSGSVPAIHFDKLILQQIGELNAEIDVDLYVLD